MQLPSFFSEPTPALIVSSFAILAVGTLNVLWREAKTQRPPPIAFTLLALSWGAALALRLQLSPRTFLHEYYHVAETVAGYLSGHVAPQYGNTGPALYRAVAAISGRPDDVQIIFITNAILSSLAIPAVALLDLTLFGSWPRAVCAAVLLCVLPQHLRFSAAEDLFILSVTFGLWALDLVLLHLRTRRLGDGLLAALALSLAVQSRPEMLLFPLAVAGLVAVARAAPQRALADRRTMIALGVFSLLLVPRLLEFTRALQDAPAPAMQLPEPLTYLANLVLFQATVTPPVYWVLLLVGLAWGLRRKPRVTCWVVLVYFGGTAFSASVFSNPQYDLRTQLLPTSLTTLVAAGAACVWMEMWGRGSNRNPPRRTDTRAATAGLITLAVVSAFLVASRRGFITELRDQQLEWAFLERSVPHLPERGTLISAMEVRWDNLDTFPRFLLERARKNYDAVDLKRAVRGEVEWPAADENLLYYQGMFCYFAFPNSEPTPDPITEACRAVYERYAVEPLYVEELHTHGYSHLRYAHDGEGPFRIGFFRLRARFAGAAGGRDDVPRCSSG